MAEVNSRVIVVLLALAVVATACGGDDGVDPSQNESAGADTTTTAGADDAGEVADGASGQADDGGGRGATLEALDGPTVSMGEASGALGGLRPADGPTSSGSITFSDIATNPAMGLGYARMPSPRYAQALALWEASLEQPVTVMDSGVWPARPQGTPGVALFDADGDADLDMYVTNAAGTPNSLFINQLREQGTLSFVDTATAAGADLAGVESSGVCAGDVDNDGDTDLFVTSHGFSNQLLRNAGAGTFAATAVGPVSLGGSSCAMGDVTGDGLLDIAVGHAWDHAGALPLVAIPFEGNLPNELLVQQPDGSFLDEAGARGVLDLAGVPEGAQGITWGVALVDIDADGDLDLLEADDQGALPSSAYDGVDRGFVQVFRNDGTGAFDAVDAGTLVPGTWMGLSFADLDCDRDIDVFGSNFGDYGIPALGEPYELGDYATRWFLSDGSGGFTDPGVGDLGTTHFAWGGVSEDFDLDGDPDLLFQGGLDLSLFVELSNPGTLLTNDGCDADFTRQTGAFDTNHLARIVTGTAAGDLDEDGFVDVVTVANAVVPEEYPVFPLETEYGLDTDGTGFFTSRFTPNEEGLFTYNGVEFAPGSLTVERNGGNTNKGVAVGVVGAVGLTEGAIVPRSGIGAVVTIIGEDGQAFTKPVQSGTGYLSNDGPLVHAGVSSGAAATVEVVWPGGIRNRFYDVPTGTTFTAPEIPCAFDDPEVSTTAYTACVAGALADLSAAGVVDDAESERLLSDALRAREEG